MNKTSRHDPFDIDSLRLSPEELLQYNTSQEKSKRRRSKKDEFCQIPFYVMADVSRAGCPVTGVLAALYETWFRDTHYNPVRLTSQILRKYGVTRHQKLRTLKLLEKSGRIWVDREHGKNPFVTLKWLPLKSEFPR
jgi:hypothetical protein